jgi:hypothetical protein
MDRGLQGRSSWLFNDFEWGTNLTGYSMLKAR